MQFKNNDKKLVYEDKDTKGFFLGKSGKLDFVFLEIGVRNKIDSHILEIPASFYVVSGSGVCNVNGKVYNVSEGDILTVEANQNRSWLNNGDSLLKILVIKDSN